MHYCVKCMYGGVMWMEMFSHTDADWSDSEVVFWSKHGLVWIQPWFLLSLNSTITYVRRCIGYCKCKYKICFTQLFNLFFSDHFWDAGISTHIQRQCAGGPQTTQISLNWCHTHHAFFFTLKPNLFFRRMV